MIARVDPREGRAERSQFRDQPPSREAMASHRRSRLYLREFAKNSRILPPSRPEQIELHNLFFPRRTVSQNSAGIS